jgi:hypothetical protein
MQNLTEKKTSKQSRPSTHTEPESEHLKPIAKDGASAVAANTDVALCQARRHSNNAREGDKHKKSSEERVGVVKVLRILVCQRHTLSTLGTDGVWNCLGAPGKCRFCQFHPADFSLKRKMTRMDTDYSAGFREALKVQILALCSFG